MEATNAPEVGPDTPCQPEDMDQSNTPNLSLDQSNTPNLSPVQSNTPNLSPAQSNTPDLNLDTQPWEQFAEAAKETIPVQMRPHRSDTEGSAAGSSADPGSPSSESSSQAELRLAMLEGGLNVQERKSIFFEEMCREIKEERLTELQLVYNMLKDYNAVCDEIKASGGPTPELEARLEEVENRRLMHCSNLERLTEKADHVTAMLADNREVLQEIGRLLKKKS